MIDVIFSTQAKWADASDPIAELAKSLRIAGMGDAEVKACLANEAVQNGVIADYRGGEDLGVNSTPSLFINGEQFKGARSVEELDAAFAKLAKSQSAKQAWCRWSSSTSSGSPASSPSSTRRSWRSSPA